MRPSIVSLHFEDVGFAADALAALRLRSHAWTSAFRSLREKADSCYYYCAPGFDRTYSIPPRSLEPIRIWGIGDDASGPDWIVFQGDFGDDGFDVT